MFSDKEIQFIKSKLHLDINTDTPSGDDLGKLEEVCGEYLTLHCLDNNYEPTDEGLLCESILDKIP